MQYPYHPEAWREIRDLSEAALAGAETDQQNGAEDFIAHRWRVNMYGMACRLERPADNSDESTVYTFAFENDAVGRHFGREPFISGGLRRPVSAKPRKYGILEYCQAQGLIKEPEGTYPYDYIRTIGRVKDRRDPVQRIVGFENLLKRLLGLAQLGWQEPLELPDYRF